MDPAVGFVSAEASLPGMHADRATLFSVGALTAQLTTVAAHAEVREAKTLTAGRR